MADYRTNVFSLAPRTWLGRIVVAIVALVLLVVAAVFATVALVVGMFVAAFLVARVLWLLRKAEKERAKAFLRAEYTVEQEETARLKAGGSRRERE